MSVSGSSVKNKIFANCNEHLHSGSSCGKAESGCADVAVSDQNWAETAIHCSGFGSPIFRFLAHAPVTVVG